LASQAFDALRLDDPRPLAALMRNGASALPYLATALPSLLHTVENLARLSNPVLTISQSEGHWRRNELTITDAGRAVLRGRRDLMSLQPQPCWVGGVQVTASTWRWDERHRDAVRL